MSIKPKFAIIIPHSGRPLPCDWYIAMGQLQIPTNSTHINLWRKGMELDAALNDMMEQALSLGVQYGLVLGDDTQPPSGTILELMRVLEGSDSDVMVCGGIYTTRTPPPEPLVYMSRQGGAFWKWKVGDIFPCWGLGGGCCMYRMELFKTMPKPWFKWIHTVDDLKGLEDLFPEIIESKSGRVDISEDMFFASRMEQMKWKTIAHGGVLPIHWSPNGESFWIPANTYPTQGVKVNGEAYGWMDKTIKVEPESNGLTFMDWKKKLDKLEAQCQ